MMGHDVKYSNRSDDSELLRISKTESRVLLTRDLELYQRAAAKGIEAYFVEGLTEAGRLSELFNRFRVELSIDLEKSRCPQCNAELMRVKKEEIAAKVKEHTFRYYDEFWVCPNCGQVYWQGAHWIKIRAILREAKEASEKKKALS